MKLFVDLGNSRLKWASGERPGDWHDSGSCEVSAIAGHLQDVWRVMPVPTEVWVSGVGDPSSQAMLEQWCAGHWSLTLRYLIAAASCCGLRNGYRDPATLGSDRWAAMIGARELVPGSAFCVVDCGTAATVDTVDGDGRFIGGAILAGLGMCRQALVAGTAAIAPGPVTETTTPLANDTANAVAAGTLYGLSGAVDRLLDEAVACVGPAQVFMTGGDGARVAPLLRHPVQLVPDLVLRGLAVAVEQA